MDQADGNRAEPPAATYREHRISNGHALLELFNSILDMARVQSGPIGLEAVEFNLQDAIGSGSLAVGRAKKA